MSYVDSEPFAKMIAEYFGIDLRNVEELDVICRADGSLKIQVIRLGKAEPGKELTGKLLQKYEMKLVNEQEIEE